MDGVVVLAQLGLVIGNLAEGDVAVGGVLDLLNHSVALLQLEGEGAALEDASGELLGGAQAGCGVVGVEGAFGFVAVVKLGVLGLCDRESQLAVGAVSNRNRELQIHGVIGHAGFGSDGLLDGVVVGLADVGLVILQVGKGDGAIQCVAHGLGGILGVIGAGEGEFELISLQGAACEQLRRVQTAFTSHGVLAISSVDVGECRCSADNLADQLQLAVSSVLHLNGEGEDVGGIGHAGLAWHRNDFADGVGVGLANVRFCEFQHIEGHLAVCSVFLGLQQLISTLQNKGELLRLQDAIAGVQHLGDTDLGINVKFTGGCVGVGEGSLCRGVGDIHVQFSISTIRNFRCDGDGAVVVGHARFLVGISRDDFLDCVDVFFTNVILGVIDDVKGHATTRSVLLGLVLTMTGEGEAELFSCQLPATSFQ